MVACTQAMSQENSAIDLELSTSWFHKPEKQVDEWGIATGKTAVAAFVSVTAPRKIRPTVVESLTVFLIIVIH